MKINIHFLIILIIAIISIITDGFIYIFKLSYLIALIISLLITGILFYFIKKKHNLMIKSDFNKLDFIFIGILIIEIITQIWEPDLSYDVRNYHIYLQENPFIDKINFDFFAGRTINSFLFPLGDRMFYIFRYMLGYRLGTILSYYVLLCLYYQTKNLISIVTNSKNKYIPIFASCIFCINIIYLMLGNYYIDLLGVVFILELINIAIESNDFFIRKYKLYLSFLISGIATSIKCSNIILIFPIYLFILIKNFKDLKKLKPIDYILSIILFIVPFIIYFIDNLIQTGSPIFPYYNSILKSEWFDNISWQDPNFGIPNIIYSIVWPIIVNIAPLKTYDTYIVDYIWGIGYLVIVIYLIVSIISKRYNNKDKVFELSLLAFVMSITWAIGLMGYIRYAIILPIMYMSTIFGIIITKIIPIKEFAIKLVYLLCASFLIIIIVSPTVYDFLSFTKYRFSQMQTLIKENTLLLDRSKEKIHINGAWVTLGDDSSLVTLVREEGTPIYNFDKRFINSDKAIRRRDKLLQEELYTIIDKENEEKKREFLEANDLEIVEKIEDIHLDCMQNSKTATIYKIKNK